MRAGATCQGFWAQARVSGLNAGTKGRGSEHHLVPKRSLNPDWLTDVAPLPPATWPWANHRHL